MALPDGEKLALLGDGERRAGMDRLAQQTEGPPRSIAHWAANRIEESNVPGARGRMVGELATEQSRSARDVLAEHDDLAARPRPGRRLLPKARLGLTRSADPRRRVRRGSSPRHDGLVLVRDDDARPRGPRA
jgi:hypothetical protein